MFTFGEIKFTLGEIRFILGHSQDLGLLVTDVSGAENVWSCQCASINAFFLFWSFMNVLSDLDTES